MPEVHEIAETISETHEHAAHGHIDDALFRRRVGVLIGALACALAITSVGGAGATKRTINANIAASDAYAFYQAKTLRQQVLRTAIDQLEIRLAAEPALPAAAAAAIRRTEDGYRKDIAHWDSSPATGDGKKELLARATRAEAERDRAGEQGEWYETAEALLQIAVVVASTSVLMASRPLLWICLGFAGLGLVSAAVGSLDPAALPFGH